MNHSSRVWGENYLQNFFISISILRQFQIPRQIQIFIQNEIEEVYVDRRTIQTYSHTWYS